MPEERDQVSFISLLNKLLSFTGKIPGFTVNRSFLPELALVVVIFFQENGIHLCVELID